MSSLIPKHSGLYTDFYELTMAQGFVLTGRADKPAVFDYFFRENPFQGGYVIFAGLADLLEALEKLVVAVEDELPVGGSDETRAARAALAKACVEVAR